MPLGPAETLRELASRLNPAPLTTKEELDAFYRAEVQQVRGEDRMGLLRIQLENQLSQGQTFKAFLMGHPGVGKSTELMRMANGFADKLEVIRISVGSELNVGAMRYYDLLLLLLIRISERAASPEISGFAENKFASLLDRVRAQLSTRWSKTVNTSDGELGAGLDFPFLKFKAAMKQGRVTQSSEEFYEVSFIPELMDLCNDLLDECAEVLKQHRNKQWLILIEDFDKLNLPTDKLYEMFLGLRPSLESLRANLIITIPVWLFYSEKFQALGANHFASVVVPDIPIYTKAHQPDSEVIDALEKVVFARANPKLIDPRALKRCILASGGFLRDLFHLLYQADMFALLRKGDRITEEDAAKAIQDLRNTYKQRLGSSLPDKDEPSLEQKLDRLVSIYRRQNASVEIADTVLYRLLQRRFVLQYNGEAWMGVHPLIVDLLIEFDQLPANSPGGSTI